MNNCVFMGCLFCALIFSLPSSGESLRDPTRPLVAAESQRRVDKAENRELPALNSVLISPTRRIAIIDGKAYETDDRVGAYVVMKISSHRVILRSKSEKLELRLRSRGMKQNKQNDVMEAYMSVVKERQP